MPRSQVYGGPPITDSDSRPHLCSIPPDGGAAPARPRLPSLAVCGARARAPAAACRVQCLNTQNHLLTPRPFFSALDVRFQQRALRGDRPMSHKIAHVSDSPLNAKTSRPDAVVWGPIDGPTAERLGLSSEVESRLIQPAAPEVARAAEAVLKLVPKNVLPVEGDTAESLVARLESSDWLDGMEVKEGGHGKGGRYVLLNSEEYPQPRRKSWSVLVKEEMEDEDGDHVHWLLAYKVPAKKSSWHCTVTAQHPAPRAAHRHTSPLRLRGGGARKIRETVGGTRCAPHTKGLLGYFIGRTLKQEQVYVDVVKEVAPGHPALSPLGEILPFCRELPGADYLC